MRPAIVSGIVTKARQSTIGQFLNLQFDDVIVKTIYWPIFSRIPGDSPRLK